MFIRPLPAVMLLALGLLFQASVSPAFAKAPVYTGTFSSLAVSGYDGAMDYIYYEGWNDFNIGRLRQHNFVYPTADGVIDTIQWEGYREGIDDLRYWATLQNAVKKAEKAGRTGIAGKAKAFLDAIEVTSDLYHDGTDNTNFSPGTDMGAVRERIIDWILRLGKPE